MWERQLNYEPQNSTQQLKSLRASKKIYPKKAKILIGKEEIIKLGSEELDISYSGDKPYIISWRL